MTLQIKKIFFILLINSTFFLVLIIGIQNSIKKQKVNFLINHTIELPVGFIVGVSFISGSLVGSLISINDSFKK
tara:strand:+ start:245 stop:466 length:222 start_codon:yes stop_codon:yes gene_type:complete